MALTAKVRILRLTGNPPGDESRFTNGWMGIIGEIRVPLPENLLVEVGEVTLAANSTLQLCASSDSYPGTHNIHEAPPHPLLTACFIFQQVN